MKSAFSAKIPDTARNPEIVPPEPNPVRNVPPIPCPDVKPDRKPEK